MTLLDVLIGLLLLLFLLRGIWVGLIGQLAFLAALLLGFVAAGTFYDRFAFLLAPLISQPQVSFLVTFLLLFLLVYALVMLAGWGLRRVMHLSMLGWFDRLMGGVFGAGKALFLASLLFIALSGILSGPRPFLREAFCYPYLEASSRYLLSCVRNTELRSRFLPKEPAISSLLTAVPASEPVRRDAE